MGPGLRKLVLTIHISASVGWLGAVGAFLAVAITGLAKRDAQLLKGAYLAMDWIGWYVLVPLSFASLLTGLIQSLGGRWGLFRHYWVLFKLGINLLANAVLLLFMAGLSGTAARAAAEPILSQATAAELSGNLAPVLHSSVAIVLLAAATVLSVYKPRGLTPYGWTRYREERAAARAGDGIRLKTG